MADDYDAGDTAAGLALFNGETHALTHDIDAPLRTADEQLAIKLCGEVVAIETEIAETPAPATSVIPANARAAADDLEAAGRELGILQ